MKLEPPIYAPAKWLSFVWAAIGVLAFIVAFRAGHTREAITGAAEAIFAVGMWFGRRISSGSGLLLSLLFAYSVITKVAHVVHGDYPLAQFAIAMLHVVFAAIIWIWLWRLW